MLIAALIGYIACNSNVLRKGKIAPSPAEGQITLQEVVVQPTARDTGCLEER